MNVSIFILGLVFATLGSTSAVTADELIKQINEVKTEIQSVLSQINVTRNTELNNLPQEILDITGSNQYVTQTREQLEKYTAKENVTYCKALFYANYYSLVDQIYVKALENITKFLTSVESSLEAIDLKLEDLKKQVEASTENEDKITKEIDESSKSVDKYNATVSTLVQSTLDNVKNNLFPNLAEEKVYQPITECLEKL